jgi:hypothetical protein
MHRDVLARLSLDACDREKMHGARRQRWGELDATIKDNAEECKMQN